MPLPTPERIRLHEGAEGCFIPEVAYVRQGNKVLFFRGNRSLTESVDESCEIVEDFEQLELVEREGGKYVKDGKWIVEGPYQRSDVKNANGRSYARKIWERIFGKTDS